MSDQCHCGLYGLGKDVRELLTTLGGIMSALDDLKAQVTTLQAAVDADQAGDAQVVRDMQAEIDRLTGELAGGATAAEIAEVVEGLKAIQTDVSGPNQ